MQEMLGGVEGMRCWPHYRGQQTCKGGTRSGRATGCCAEEEFRRGSPMASTHARWLADCADRCVAELRSRGPDSDYRHYANVAHQIAQARTAELREFVESYPFAQAVAIAPLMVLAWRIVGNELRSQLSRRASEEIAKLCDYDEWEQAVEAFADGNLPSQAPDRRGV